MSSGGKLLMCFLMEEIYVGMRSLAKAKPLILCTDTRLHRNLLTPSLLEYSYVLIPTNVKEKLKKKLDMKGDSLFLITAVAQELLPLREMRQEPGVDHPDLERWRNLLQR